jgi:acyl-CoA thioesterase FadM
MDSGPAIRFLTASLHVHYHKPTPLGPTLEVRGKVKSISGRRATIDEWIVANGVVTVRGQVVAVQVPESLIEALLASHD